MRTKKLSYICMTVIMLILVVSLTACGGKDDNHTHTLVRHNAVEATCTEKGNVEYWTCECGKIFSDADGNNEITKNQTIIEAHHNFVNGVCSVCQAEDDSIVKGGMTKTDWQNAFAVTKFYNVKINVANNAASPIYEYVMQCDGADKYMRVKGIGKSGDVNYLSYAFQMENEEIYTYYVQDGESWDNESTTVGITAAVEEICKGFYLDEVYAAFYGAKLISEANSVSVFTVNLKYTDRDYLQHEYEGTFTLNDKKLSKAEVRDRSRFSTNSPVTYTFADYGVSTVVLPLEIDPSHTHTYGEWEIVTEKTCTADGERKRVCTECGKAELQTISASHDYGVWVTDAEATCFASGEKHRECIKCGDLQTEVIPATGHSYSEDWSTDDEYHWHTATCSHTDEIKDKATHTWNSGEVTTQPTCIAEGVKTYTCTVCGKTKTEVMETTSHKIPAAWLQDEDAHWKECTVCHQISGKQDHVYNDNHVCTVCGKAYVSKGLKIMKISGKEEYTVQSRGTAVDKEIFIPSEYNGLPVTDISANAFSYNRDITCVRIPNSVKSIGKSAFEACSGMVDAMLSSNLISIGERAFDGCTKLIGIMMPNSVNSIGKSAFRSCDKLSTVTFGSGITTIEELTFDDCESINRVNYTGDLISWLGITFKSNPIRGAQRLYINSSLITDLVIPDGLTAVGSKAFYDYKGLVSVTIGDGVQTIGDSAFSGCSGLTSLTMGNGVQTIGNSAFSGCSGLTSLTIGNSVKTIGDSAFSNCSGLTGALIIPDGVQTIGEYAFRGCEGISGALILPDSIQTIGIGVFIDCVGLTSLTIGDGVTDIGFNAFNGCGGLMSVTIAKSVTNIELSAFKFGYSLTSVYYCGTADEWSQINIDDTSDSNKKLIDATRYYYSETEPTEEGNYWRYDVDGITPLAW